MALVQSVKDLFRSSSEMTTTDQDSRASTSIATEQLDTESVPPPDHVVVFVHGMGEALKGGTLLEWSEPLIKSLHDIALDNIEKAGVVEAPSSTESTPVPVTIEAANTTSDAPQILVSAYKPGFTSSSRREQGSSSPDDEASRLLVMFTEAHWADDFTPGKAGTTWLWGIQVARRVWWRALNLIRWNLHPPPGLLRNKAAKVLWWGIPFCLVGLISLPALALLLVVLGVLIGLSKIPGIGLWAEKVVVLFANFLGDPATWSRMPTQAAAMRQKVIDIVESVPASANVTIVAHSQGAAVAGQVTLSGRISPTNLVTVGSGLTLLGYAKYGANRCDDPVKEWVQHAPRLRWINIWGKFDFVPAGPMAEKTQDQTRHLKWHQRPGALYKQRSQRITKREQIFKLIYGRTRGKRQAAGPEEHPVFNRSAVIRDHIVYSQNRIEVIDPIARLIYDNEATPMKDPQPGSEAPTWLKKPEPSLGVSQNDEKKRGARHRRMVSFLGMTRVLCVCAGIFLALPLVKLTQPLLDSDDGSLCGPAALRWPCVQSSFDWRAFSIAEHWAVLLAVAVVAASLIWLLNGVLWTALHRQLERRRDKDGKPWCGGKSYFFQYAAVVVLTTVVLPVTLLLAARTNDAFSSGFPESLYVGYLVLAVILGAASWSAGKELPPLAAQR